MIIAHILGDGEFDSLLFQQTLTAAGWTYVCRTACHLPIQIAGEWMVLGDLARSPGVCQLIPDVRFTTQAYGPINLIAWWEAGYAKPLFLVTNAELCEEASPGIDGASQSKRWLATTKAAAFSCTQVICPTRCASRGC